MSMFDIQAIQDRTQELGLDLNSPEVRQMVARNQPGRRSVDRAAQRREQLKTNIIVALVASIVVAVLFAQAQPSIGDQVTKALKASATTPAAAAVATNDSPKAAPGKN